jgi:hypothetical protein
VNSFFDESLIEMQRFYNEIGHPNGAREEDFWEWLKEELFSARKRSLNKKEKVILALEESLKIDPHADRSTAFPSHHQRKQENRPSVSP